MHRSKLFTAIYLLLSTSFAMPCIVADSKCFAAGSVHGARAAGMGAAFIGVADDPSAIVFNPSGLTQVDGTQLYSGASAFYLKSSLETRSGESDTSDSQFFFPPHFYLTSDFGIDRFGSGIGIYSPFGYGGRHWGGGPAQFITTDDMVATMSFDVALAWEVWPGISVGGSGYYMYAWNESSRLVDQSRFDAVPGKLESEAGGGDFGYQIGLLVRLLPNVKAGINYHSAVSIEQSGDATLSNITPALAPVFGGDRYKTDVEIGVEFPEIIGFGLSWNFSSKWLLSADVERATWSSFKQLDIDFDDEVTEAGFTDVTVPLKWRDAWSCKAGLEYQISDVWTVRGGYAFIETPVPEETFSPGNPDADAHALTTGFGYERFPYWADMFFIFVLYEDRQIDNDILSGRYESDAGFIGFSIGYRF